ncbi:hypothetical protein ACQUQU_13535 [Thalassolituus sp. LLYu03]|uniref:hypothetical protein n=1 Tax=Thalassolituus sp. LLYu03 TaxID=3421656 RepID=UPI003D2AD9D6
MLRRFIPVVLAAAALVVLALRSGPGVVTTPQVAATERNSGTIPPPTSPAQLLPASGDNGAGSMPADMKKAIHQVAQAYAATATFPPYSIPLGAEHNELLTPNQGSHSHRSLEAYGLPGHLSVQLSAYRYRHDEMIDASVTLSGSDALFTQVARVSLSLRDRDGRQIQALSANASTSADHWLYHTRFGASPDWPAELNVSAEVQLTNGEHLSQSAPFSLFTPVAEISGVGDSQRDDNQLLIPVHISNAKPGYYKLGAALFYADKRPLAYLQAQGKISGSTGTLTLKVWGSLLTQLSAPQGLWLGSFQLRRIPEKPGPEVGFGISQKDFYAVEEVNPADYQQVPFQDAQTASRVQFLQSLAGPVAGRAGS